MATDHAVIVALPTELDPVRLIGDEEKHATLLYFGEIDTLPSDAKETILEALKLSHKLFRPFTEGYFEVARLGDENPPALVAMFERGGYLSRIRSVIQVNPKIKSYLDNAEQYPQYTPHLTFGYPDYKGEADIRNKAARFRRVTFDRIALWWGEESHVFELKHDVDESVAWSDTNVGKEFIEHYGIKGMKWGVRRTQKQIDAASEDASTANTAKAKASRSGTDALSNQELQTLITRQNLEKQYRDLNPTPDRGFVKKTLKSAGKTEVNKVVNAAAATAVRQAFDQAAKKSMKVDPDDAKKLIPTSRSKALGEMSTRLKPKK